VSPADHFYQAATETRWKEFWRRRWSVKGINLCLFLGRLPCSRNFFFFFCQSGRVMIPQIGVIFSGMYVFLGASCYCVVDREALLEAEK